MAPGWRATRAGEAIRDFGEIARELPAEHKATDEVEDEHHGEARGDELPEPLRTPEGRREFFRQARQRPADQTAGRKELAGEPAGSTGSEADAAG